MKGAQSRVRVTFEAEVLLIGDEVPDDFSALAQAVQDTLGYSGVRVLDVSFWEVEA